MIIRNAEFAEFARKVRKEQKKIVVYGCGMIGQVVVPYIIDKYRLHKYLDCYVDADKRKEGNVIWIDRYSYRIKTPDYLYETLDDIVILITNSKFYPVIRFLDEITCLNETEGYIVPVMQLHDLESGKSIDITKRSREPLIPQKIHYCWFGGGELPAFLKECISTWKKFCPDYEIVEWNEQNYDINRHEFTREAYEKGKYSFVSDVARLDILYENGGIYFDTDVSVLKNLDVLLYQEAFIGVERWGNINSGGGCGFIKGHPVLKEMSDYRRRTSVKDENGTFLFETNGLFETGFFREKGFEPDNSLQVIEGVTIYPSYVHHPYDYMSCERHDKEATVSIHHFAGGWMEEEDRNERRKTQEEYQSVCRRIKETENC